MKWDVELPWAWMRFPIVFKVICQISRSHGLKNRFESDLIRNTRLVAAIKSLRLALLSFRWVLVSWLRNLLPPLTLIAVYYAKHVIWLCFRWCDIVLLLISLKVISLVMDNQTITPMAVVNSWWISANKLHKIYPQWKVIKCTTTQGAIYKMHIVTCLTSFQNNKVVLGDHKVFCKHVIVVAKWQNRVSMCLWPYSLQCWCILP